MPTATSAPNRLGLLAALLLAVACNAPRTSPTPGASTSSTALPISALPASAVPTAPPGPTDGPPGTYREFSPEPALLAAARSEGLVTTLALPDGACNVRELIRIFRERTGVEVAEVQAEAGDDAALRALADGVAGPGTPGPDGVDGPDVIELGVAAADSARAQGLLQAHQVIAWPTVPDGARDPDGSWTGAWYDVVAFEVNTDVATSVPGDWPDLLRGELAAQVALAGDPRTSTEAMHAVYAAALANGGSVDDASPGLDFFADLQAAGTFLPVVAKTGTVAAGETPVRIAWSSSALADRAALEGTAAVDVVIPATGRLGGVSVQAISATAPHPNAARLWLEFVLSDEGQNLVLEGACHPIRLDDLVARSQVPPARLAVLPEARGAAFPDAGQLRAAASVIADGWANLGIDIVCTFECE